MANSNKVFLSRLYELSNRNDKQGLLLDELQEVADALPYLLEEIQTLRDRIYESSLMLPSSLYQDELLRRRYY